MKSNFTLEYNSSSSDFVYQFHERFHPFPTSLPTSFFLSYLSWIQLWTPQAYTAFSFAGNCPRKMTSVQLSSPPFAFNPLKTTVQTCWPVLSNHVRVCAFACVSQNEPIRTLRCANPLFLDAVLICEQSAESGSLAASISSNHYIDRQRQRFNQFYTCPLYTSLPLGGHQRLGWYQRVWKLGKDQWICSCDTMTINRTCNPLRSAFESKFSTYGSRIWICMTVSIFRQDIADEK